MSKGGAVVHTWQVIAFVLFCCAAVVAGVQKAWAVCLIAAGLAAYLVPVVLA
jgi:hypothetical protein